MRWLTFIRFFLIGGMILAVCLIAIFSWVLTTRASHDIKVTIARTGFGLGSLWLVALTGTYLYTIRVVGDVGFDARTLLTVSVIVFVVTIGTALLGLHGLK